MDICSELDANVWKVLVATGDGVAEGQGLIILESMKMEINVDAPAAGRIARIAVAEGDAIVQGQVLVELDTE